MAYYQGDYYQGDYYQGDPFLGALFGKGIGWLAKKIFKRKLSPQAMTVAGTRTTQALARGAGTGIAAVGAAAMIPSFTVSPGSFLPGGNPFISRAGRPGPQGMAVTGGAQICCPTGFHPNKQTSMAKTTMGAPAGTICVRNRTMNVANPRALRRGLRRVAGFGKLAMRSRKTIRATAKAMG